MPWKKGTSTEPAAGADVLPGGLEWFCEWQAGRPKRGLRGGELRRVAADRLLASEW